MHKKIRVGVLFGGQSAEHEISLQSAKSIIEGIDHGKYEVIPIGIDKEGSWFFLKEERFFDLFTESETLPSFEGRDGEILFEGSFSPCMLRETIDVLFPVLHGPYGEDGTVQGIARLANLPFVGTGVLGSAICMDKGIAKRILRDAKLPTPHFLCLKTQDSIDVEKIIQEIGLPLFVKPSNLGSSIAITKVIREDALLDAIQEAFKFDEKVIIEESIEGRELECAVLGNLFPIASLPGEIITSHEFYSYEAKYLDQEGSSLFELPAKLADEIIKDVQSLAIKAFTLLECEGMARVDFFLKENGTLLINEINTIPGFTSISLYPKLWEISGIPYPELIGKLLEYALERHERNAIWKRQNPLKLDQVMT